MTDAGLIVTEAGVLRAMVLPDGPYWFVHGLEIDYAEQGSSLEEALDYFERGLRETIELRVSQQNALRKAVGAKADGSTDGGWRWRWLAHAVSEPSTWTEFFKRLANKEFTCRMRPLCIPHLPFDTVWYFCSQRP
jgi:hypothetical protein